MQNEFKSEIPCVRIRFPYKYCMRQRLPSLNMLRAFEVVARHLSFSKAAHELCVTQAAVSQLVKALETQLGVLLVRRLNRRIELTEAGKAGFTEFRRGFEALSRGFRNMDVHARRQVLKLRVEPTLAATWLIPRLSNFRRNCDVGDILIDTSLDLPDFERDDIDMAIHFGVGYYPGFKVRQLFEDDVFPVCSPKLLEGDNPLRELNDLRFHTLLHLETIPGYREWPDWSTWLASTSVNGIDIKCGSWFSDHRIALQAAVDGQGVAIATMALVADDLAEGRLVAPFDKHLTTSYGYYLVWPEDVASKKPVVDFLEWICDSIDLSKCSKSRVS